MIRKLWIALLLAGVRLEAEALSSNCALCVMSGECGCRLGHVVCCDGTDAYGCTCR